MARDPEERKVDKAVEDSFPASDPPAYSSTPKSDKPEKKPEKPGEEPEVRDAPQPSSRRR